MGYGGMVEERRRARELRAQSWTLQEIADELGVSKGSVSVWVRDVDFEPRSRRIRSQRRPHPLTVKKQEQLDRCREEAASLFGSLSERELLVFGLALYLGEGFKTDGRGVGMANTSADVLRFFVSWLRRFFTIDESRLRVRIYLHRHLDIDAATRYWSEVLAIPPEQFTAPYRAEPRSADGRSKHEYGCPSVRYADNLVHRRVMAMIAAIASQGAGPG